MFRYVSTTVALVLLVLLASPVFADEPKEKDFRLLRDSAVLEMEKELEEQAAEYWDKQLQPRKLELSFSIGFLNLNTTVFSHEQIIYKYVDAATSWGDVDIKGKSAFSPCLRLNYNFNAWFALEGLANLSISEYESSVTNRSRRSNEEGSSPEIAEPELEEYDVEKRSLVAFLGSANVVIYPLNFDGDAMGAWHPFLTAGAGRIFYNMNSNYTGKTASTMDYCFGGGVRMILDKSVSIRADVAYHTNDVQFTPAEYFKKLNEGTKIIPLDEFPRVGGEIIQQEVTEYASHRINSLQWSLGFQVTF